MNIEEFLQLVRNLLPEGDKVCASKIEVTYFDHMEDAFQRAAAKVNGATPEDWRVKSSITVCGHIVTITVESA